MNTRPPLSACNGSRLPQPGRKRTRSSEEVTNPEKKCRVELKATVKPGLPKTKSTATLKGQVSGILNGRRVTNSSAVTRTSRLPPKSKSSVPPFTRPKPAGAVPIPKPTVVPGQNTGISNGGSKKSRPGWDLKGRLQDMEEHMRRQTKDSSTLHSQLSQYNERIALLETQNEKLNGDVKEKEMASDTALKDIQDLTSQLRKAEEHFCCKKKSLEREIEDLKDQKSSLDRQKASVEMELDCARKEKASLKCTLTELIAAQASIKAELESVKILFDTAQRDIQSKAQTITDQTATINENYVQIEMLQQKDRNHETERRKLHNTIQELKGNIRVFCRVRPLLGEELLGTDGVVSHINFPDLDHKVVELDKLNEMSVNESILNTTRAGRLGSKYEFTFDRIFEPDNTQADVFEEISQLIQSSLDGYNVCIFAYGQTGSGKTYTMEGNLTDSSQLGMIPRAVEQIFATSSNLAAKGWEYKFEASMLEIYNESIRDLLAKSKDEKHEIKMTGKTGDVHVTNLTVVHVQNEDQVLKLLHKACVNRSVAETKCNERSSRSHSVFQMKMTGTNKMTGETSQGTLNLIDLAGSERVKDSGSEGQRLIEAQCINKSLSNLGNVIMALGNKDKHIPYRNSKLTYLLQNSLGGNSKALMFVNISPKEECFSESLNSLRFATKVNQCHVGTAQRKK